MIFFNIGIYSVSLPSQDLKQKIDYYAYKYNLSKELVYAVCFKESSYNRMAKNKNKSSKGYSIGIMQLNQNYFKHWKLKDFYNLDKNLNTGCKLLKRYLELSGNNYYQALVYYNYGRGNFLKYKRVPLLTDKYAKQVVSLMIYFESLDLNNYVFNYEKLLKGF
jgi:soluble lytic murein transglycosylase-like protein